ncbi:MAG: hydrogenase maturation nickel metallochaperone HypA [Cyclobacteriaceae bacterium]
MHELSIVMGIIDIAEEAVRKNHARKVDSIELEIGTMAGIEPQALDFAWEVAVKNTVLAHADREIITIKAKARCMDCGAEFLVHDQFEACPMCHDFLNEFIQGKELRVKSLVVS